MNEAEEEVDRAEMVDAMSPAPEPPSPAPSDEVRCAPVKDPRQCLVFKNGQRCTVLNTARPHKHEFPVQPPPIEVAEPHPEDHCSRCKGRNVVWFAPNSLWNRGVRRQLREQNTNSIICPLCFVEMMEAAGIHSSAWQVTPEGWSTKDSRACPCHNGMPCDDKCANEHHDNCQARPSGEPEELSSPEIVDLDRAQSTEFVGERLVYAADSSDPMHVYQPDSSVSQDVPERIWIDWPRKQADDAWFWTHGEYGNVKYIPADRLDSIRKAADECEQWWLSEHVGYWTIRKSDWEVLRNAINGK